MSIDIHIATDQATKEDIYNFRYKIQGMSLSGQSTDVDHTREWICDDADKNAHLLYAQHEGSIVGTMRININDKGQLPVALRNDYFTGPLEKKLGANQVAVISRFMADPKHKGQTLVSLVFNSMYQYCLKVGAQAAFHRCEKNMLPLYHRLGYRSFYRHLSGKGVPMLLCLRDFTHMNKVMSPFASNLTRENDDGGKIAKMAAKVYGDFQLDCNVMPTNLATFWAELADHYARAHANRPNIFDGMCAAEINLILNRAKRKTYKAGDVLPAFDMIGFAVGVVLKGKIGDALPRAKGHHWLEIFREGDGFGEPGLKRKDQVESQLIALEDCEVAIIPPNTIEHLKHCAPLLATRFTMNLITFMEQRVNNMEERVILDEEICVTLAF